MQGDSIVLGNDINTDADRIKRLNKLYELSMTLSGDPIEVFQHVARMIGELFDVRVVCLSEIRGEELFFLSICIDGQTYQDAGQCSLAITPCATVEVSKDVQIYDRVSERFPEASFLKDHNAFSYCGFPALDSHENVIAVTCLLDDKPHEFTAEDQDLMRIFGQRISMELERQQHIDKRRKTEEHLRHVQAMMLHTERLASIGSWEWSISDGAVYWSPEMYRLHQIDPENFSALTPDSVLSSVHQADVQRMQEHINRVTKSGVLQPTEYRLSLSDGTTRIVKAEGMTTEYKENIPSKIVGFVQDISELKIAQSELEESLDALKHAEQEQRALLITAQHERQRMSALLSAMSIGILFEDRVGNVEFVNPAFKHLWAIDKTVDLTGRPTLNVLSHSTHRFARPDHASKHVMQVLDTNEISERFEIDLYDGRTLTQVSYPVTDLDGSILGRLWIYEDITQERQTARQLLYLAERDPLTGLRNRHSFQERLEQYFNVAQRHTIRFALLYFDLDEFKYVNDTYGHRAGDNVLIRVAGEISSLVRANETFARLGGDEFAILLDQNQRDDPTILASRVVHSVSSIPFRFRGTNIRLTASVGIALFPEHGLGVEDLVAHADAAMYQAKSRGKNNWYVYDPNRDLSEAMTARMNWKTRISQALEQDLFEIHFQGIYDTGTLQLRHLEALVRMRDPLSEGDLIMPNQFIPVAEKSGQIIDIDRWVLKHCIQLLAQYPKITAVAVNISGRSFDETSLPHYIQNQLSENAVEPSRLILELTETAAVSDVQDAQRFIEEIHQAGCRVCLDDFGSGFSTFGYLKYLGVEILKIDGMFIRDLVHNHDNQIFVKAMVDVARGLGKNTVAEFVEDAATLDMILDLGINFAQGYHLDRPSPNIPPAFLTNR